MVKVGDSFLIIHTTFCYSGTCYYRKCQVFFYRLDDLQLRKVKRNLEFHFGLIAQKKGIRKFGKGRDVHGRDTRLIVIYYLNSIFDYPNVLQKISVCESENFSELQLKT